MPGTRRRRWHVTFAVRAAFVAVAYPLNASWIAGPSGTGPLEVLAPHGFGQA